MDEEKLKEYPTYNALEREALVWGVPVYWFAVIFFLITIGSFLLVLLFSWKVGLVWSVLLAVVFLVVRVMCELDSKAMKRYEKFMKRIWLNITHGRNLFLTPYNANWKKVLRTRQALSFVYSKRHNSTKDGD
ncbi:TPA: VirB3 family type IV secretion system protein [Escherichia coli]|nr:VirB3 family type IV secretion system protein [Escherichia coli]